MTYFSNLSLKITLSSVLLAAILCNGCRWLTQRVSNRHSNTTTDSIGKQDDADIVSQNEPDNGTVVSSIAPNSTVGDASDKDSSSREQDLSLQPQYVPPPFKVPEFTMESKGLVLRNTAKQAIAEANYILSLALRDHAPIRIDTAVDKIIAIANEYPSNKLLRIMKQIMACSKKVASPEYKTALEGFALNSSILGNLSDDKREFLKSTGYEWLKADSSKGFKESMSDEERGLRGLLNLYGDFSPASLESGDDFDGKKILSLGAERCFFQFSHAVDAAAAVARLEAEGPP